MDNKKIKIESGTINFWIEKQKIIFNDNKVNPIISINPDGGSIFILKDTDNKLKIFYVVLDKGRIDLEYDVSNLLSNERHMITFTWNIDNKLSLFIDTQEVINKKVEF